VTSKLPGVEEQRRFYDELWADVGAESLNRHERARFEAIARVLTKHLHGEPRPTILEVGCGRGWLSGLLLQRLGGVTALDLSPQAVRKARERFPEVKFDVHDVFVEPLPDANDLVVSSEVLEHVEDQATFVQLLSGAVKLGGLLLITTPNGRWTQRWMARPDVRRQPIEQWLHPSELANLVARRCDIVVHTTVFVPWHDGSRAGRAMMRFDRHLGSLGPASLTAALGGGLYSVLLARRRRGD
jgi:2-polyprenyl-3-methyl-5-hydroxy-6-metoxy-1,4-benzoquinol methylase